MTDFSGRSALVTGGSRGLGRAAALALAEAGADVAVVYRRDDDSAEEVVGRIKAMGRRAIAVRADVTDAEQVRSAVQRALATLGGLDFVIAAAGQGNPWLSLVDTPPEKWRRLLASNLDSVFYTLQASLPTLLQQKRGCAVVFTSTGGLRATPMQGAYAAAKAAVMNLTATWAAEVAGLGVRVNAVCPGLFETDMTANLRKGPMPPIPAGRIGQPSELGKIVTFLCSDAADYINGEVIRVDGAWYG